MSHSLSAAQRQSGFTLLEVMIAIALTALVGLGVAQLVNQLVTARERFATPPPLDADVDFSRLVERRLEALVVRPVREQGLLQFNAPLAWRVSPPRLDWVSRGSAALPIGDYYTRLRRQRLEWDSDSQRLTLYSAGLLDAAGAPQWQRVAVLEGVERLDVAFYAGGRWHETPPPDGHSRGVRLTWQHGGDDIVVVAPLPDPPP
ncbi:prepilin-type N-terminal cleavage/methylation domain-containing protein [Kushneria aurantia]|uniref:Type II secretion system protein J n=1 Tax=Kushneria aurantia TaxID=504092 RepID=A0ABV6G719_9GAMM|nr:prepilin-type N-terminal cleavage/methylation domain-containing protein [Kushneria aurantia]